MIERQGQSEYSEEEFQLWRASFHLLHGQGKPIRRTPFITTHLSKLNFTRYGIVTTSREINGRPSNNHFAFLSKRNMSMLCCPLHPRRTKKCRSCVCQLPDGARCLVISVPKQCATQLTQRRHPASPVPQAEVVFPIQLGPAPSRPFYADCSTYPGGSKLVTDTSWRCDVTPLFTDRGPQHSKPSRLALNTKKMSSKNANVVF